jgi:ATP-dependent Clp protease adapter protein ClpS
MITDILKSTKQASNATHEEPAKWQLVLHARPGYDEFTRTLITHALKVHLSFTRAEGTRILEEAYLRSKSVCRVVTKDVGETLLKDVYSCPSLRSNDFSFKLEQA